MSRHATESDTVTDTETSTDTDATDGAAVATAGDTPEAELVLRLTEAALTTVTGIRDSEDDADTLALRVEVTGARGSDFTYDLAFEAYSQAAPEDSVTVQDGLTVWIPAGSVERLQGATLDIPSTDGQGGLVLRNPNRPDPLGMDDSIELTGTVEERITQLLVDHINPALAAHGGYAELVKVEGSTAHVTMGGGCQGCAVSAMTLRDGIQAAIIQRVPEITEVTDLTDHDAGDNPYYTSRPDDPYG